METLKKLEEDEKLPGEMDKNQTPQNWREHRGIGFKKLSLPIWGLSFLTPMKSHLFAVDDLEREPSTDPVDLLTADKLEQLNRRKDNRNQQGGLLTDEKLRSILSFLDEVETAERVSEIDQVSPIDLKQMWQSRVPPFRWRKDRCWASALIQSLPE